VTHFPSTRAHVWVGGVCRRCGMRAAWEGARHGCEGPVTWGIDKGAAPKPRAPRPVSALRAEVESVGIRWTCYRQRIRRGWTHAEAVSGVRANHISSSEHDSEQRKGATS